MAVSHVCQKLSATKQLKTAKLCNAALQHRNTPGSGILSSKTHLQGQVIFECSECVWKPSLSSSNFHPCTSNVFIQFLKGFVAPSYIKNVIILHTKQAAANVLIFLLLPSPPVRKFEMPPQKYYYSHLWEKHISVPACETKNITIASGKKRKKKHHGNESCINCAVVVAVVAASGKISQTRISRMLSSSMVAVMLVYSWMFVQ